MYAFARRPSLLALVVWLFVAAALVPAAHADEPLPIEIRRVELGYGGTCKSGFVAPVWLTLRSGRDVTGVVEVLSADGDGVPVAFSAWSEGKPALTTLKAHDDTTLCIYVKLGPQQSGLAAQLRDESGAVLWSQRFPAETPRPVDSAAELIVSLGDFPALADAAPLVPRGHDKVAIAAQVTDPARIPESWWAMEGVKAIVVPIAAGSVAEKLSNEQWHALRQWVELGGGRLVVCLGRGSRDTLAGDHPLTKIIPATLGDEVPLRDLDRLGELTGHAFAIASGGDRPALTELTLPRGRVELTVTGQREELPLLVRASQGFGEVVVLALNPEGPALADWPGRSRLLLPALVEEEKNAAAVKSPRRSLRLGYDDLIGQLRMALDDFPRVRVVSLTTVAMLTLAYLALIGPLEFFVLRRLRLSSLATWIVFPLLVALFCAVGWYAAGAAHGTAPMVRHCEIIDIDQQEQLVRGTTWVHVYSPRTATYGVSLACDGAPIVREGALAGWLSWQGLPGKGLGGLSANQLTSPAMLSYAHPSAGPELSLTGVPIQIAGSKALSARWWGATNLPPPGNLSINSFDLLVGEIANPLPVELHDCLLVYNEWMYRLKTLTPGQRVRVADLDMLNLEARLQQRTVANAKDIISPWEPESSDVPRIVQMLMFHESSRGSAYTNLTHRYQGYLDLTAQIRNDRAILVGRLPKSATQVTLDGAPIGEGEGKNSWSWVRIVLPVAPHSRSAPAP